MTDYAERHQHLTDLPGRLELAAPADPSMLDLVHALLEQLWVTHGDVAERDRARFETAVIEILANIVEHAFAADESPELPRERRFDVALGVTDGELLASFSDNGRPIDLDLSNVAMPDELAESGRGLALAVAALDDLAYRHEDGRNHWNLLCVRDVGGPSR